MALIFKQPHKKKLAGIILMVTFIVPLIYYNGAIDAFAPKHIVLCQQIIQQGNYPEIYTETQAPGFYTLGAELLLTTGLSGKELVFFPIQIIPFIIVFFVLIYKLSNSLLLASIITFIELISGTTGSLKVFFFVHGIGSIIFYTTIIALLHILCNHEVLKFELILVLLGISLIYGDYDLTAVTFILLTIIFLLNYTILKVLPPKNKKITSKSLFLSRRIFMITLILLIVELGLCEFVYKTFVPLLKTLNNIEISGIDKFFLTYFPHTEVTNPISEIYFQSPEGVAIISAIKYLALLISIILFLVIIGENIKKGITLNKYDLITVSIIFMAVVYGIIRYAIGGIVVTLLYLPGILSTVWLYRFSKNFKKWAILVILLLLVLVPLYDWIYYENRVISKDENKFVNIDAPAYWYFENRGNSTALSDELTKGLFILQKSETNLRENIKINYTKLNNQIKIFSICDLKFLYQNQSNIQENKENKDFIINYNINTVDLSNWEALRPWNFSKSKIENYPQMDKIYDNGVAIFVPS